MHRITNMSSHNHSLFKLSINNQSLTSDCIPADTCSTAFWTFSWSSCSLTSQRKTSSGFCCRASPRPQRAQRCEGCGAGFSMRKLLEQCGAVLDTGKQRRGRPTMPAHVTSPTGLWSIGRGRSVLYRFSCMHTASSCSLKPHLKANQPRVLFTPYRNSSTHQSFWSTM